MSVAESLREGKDIFAGRECKGEKDDQQGPGNFQRTRLWTRPTVSVATRVNSEQEETSTVQDESGYNLNML